MYAIHEDAAALKAALKLAKGCYQIDILMGREALSGATLRGKAKSYSGKYKRSAENLIKRCRAAGIPMREAVGGHNKRLLIVG